MLLFRRVVLFAGVVTGITAAVFYFRPTTDLSVAQLTPLELEQLRQQIRQRVDDSSPHSAVRLNEQPPLMTPAGATDYEFKSGLSPQERQALREQVRDLTPDLRVGGGEVPESVAVNESYPDGVTIPVNNLGASGQTR